jgi:hypothetical protein
MHLLGEDVGDQGLEFALVEVQVLARCFRRRSV